MGAHGEPTPLESSLGDPTLDAAGILGLECFLCGKPVLTIDSAGWFGPKGRFAVSLPCHHLCISTTPLSRVTIEYSNRVSDVVFAPRSSS